MREHFAYQQGEIEGWLAQSLADSARAIKLDQSVALPFILHGHASLGQLDYARAIDDFDTAIKINPTSYSAYGGRARVHTALGDYSKARDDLATALSLNPAPDDRPILEADRRNLDSNYVGDASVVSHNR